MEDAAALDVGSLGPMPTQWTAGLVHCRLKVAAEIAAKLPRVNVPPMYRSFLGEMQPQDAAPVRRSPLSAEDAELLDWKMTRLFTWDDADRAVLMGVMSGRSFEKIAAILRYDFGQAALI